MARYATFMTIKEGMEERYIDVHRAVWPEVLEGIRRAGIRNYTIFRLGRRLFSYFECDDLDGAMTRIAADPVNQQWQQLTNPLLEVGPGIRDGSTVYLEEIFHVD